MLVNLSELFLTFLHASSSSSSSSNFFLSRRVLVAKAVKWNRDYWGEYQLLVHGVKENVMEKSEKSGNRNIAKKRKTVKSNHLHLHILRSCHSSYAWHSWSSVRTPNSLFIYIMICYIPIKSIFTPTQDSAATRSPWTQSRTWKETQAVIRKVRAATRRPKGQAWVHKPV